MVGGKIATVDLYLIENEPEEHEEGDDWNEEETEYHVEVRIGDSEIPLHNYLNEDLDSERIEELLTEINPEKILERKKEELKQMEVLKKEIKTLEKLTKTKESK